MKKKVLIISSIVVVLLAVVFLLWKFVFSNNATPAGDENPISVSSVATITGVGSGISSQTRFSGVVEAQKTLDIKKDADKKISTLYVAEGDAVKAGAKLFKYDTDDISLKLEQAKLEVENIANKIDMIYTQISDLEKERAKADDSEYLNYTLQIQSLQLDVKTEEYNKTTKIAEVDSIEKSLTTTVVKSEIDGIIKSINSTGESMNGQEAPYMSILSTGNYRVKSTVSELSMNAISQGQAVIIRSRVDPELTWTGTIESIDREKAVEDQNQSGGMMYAGNGGGGTVETATKYNFFVALDNFKGLILGQHVYTELDFGQAEEKKEGLWLPASYIISEEGKSFVWVRGNNERIEKRQITLGEQDADMDTYEVKDGLSVTDFIAFPQEGLENGMSTIVGTFNANIAPTGPEGEMGGEIGSEIGGEMGGEALVGGEENGKMEPAADDAPTEAEPKTNDTTAAAQPEGKNEG